MLIISITNPARFSEVTVQFDLYLTSKGHADLGPEYIFERKIPRSLLCRYLKGDLFKQKDLEAEFQGQIQNHH